MYVLKWAWEREFRGAPGYRPVFVEYLDAHRSDEGKPLAASTFDKICKVTRAFFDYMRDRHGKIYAKINRDWIDSIRPPRLRSEQAVVRQREIYTLEDTIRLATWPAEDLRTRRTQAGVAFLFLTGMRVGAFTSLPISCVDLDGLRVSQFPALGVRTKNKKAAVTTILPIGELMGVVRAWDAAVRAALPADGLWYPNLSRMDEAEMSKDRPNERYREKSFREDLVELCKMAGIKYLSPHKFRHGHAVYGLKRARNMQEWKAVSQNLMHSNTGITDAIYGNLVADDQHETMVALAGSHERRPAADDLAELVEAAVRRAMGRGDGHLGG